MRRDGSRSARQSGNPRRQPCFRCSETLKSVRFEAGSALKTVSSRAFDNCAKLETVELPETVTEIGSSAFYYCVSLTEINFPAAVKQVGDYAFSSCSSLAVLDIPADSQLESIGTSLSVSCISSRKSRSPRALPCCRIKRFSRARRWKRLRSAAALRKSAITRSSRVIR